MDIGISNFKLSHMYNSRDQFVQKKKKREKKKGEIYTLFTLYKREKKHEKSPALNTGIRKRYEYR